MSKEQESFTLLRLSEESDSISDVPEIVINARKKKVKRRRNSVNSKSRGTFASNTNYGLLRIVGFWICGSVVFFWLFILSWIGILLHGELRHLDSSLLSVSASSKGVPEALQQCHETTRKLTTNQTILFGKTDDLNERLSNLTSQLFAVQSELDALKSKLKSSPELVKVPQQLSDLSNSVAQFGSQIKDLEATVGSLKDQGSKLQTASDTLQSNITAIQAQVSNQSAANAAASQVPNREDVAIREQLMHDVELAKQQVILTNTTLSKQLQWTNDEQKSNKAKLEALLENKVKVESQIATLEGSQSSNLKRIETLEYSVGNLTQELNKTKNSIPSITPNAIVDLQPKTSNDSLKELKPEAIISSSTSANITKTTESSSVLAAHAIFGPNETKPPDNATNAINDTSSSIAPILMKGNQPGKPNVLSAVKEQ
uniref:Putative conserved plasma membrane protein n=1 Tax=Xenopsylla cheopis TaxID=163159 RepID=A0A6M2DSX3_XENCH